MIFQGPGSFLQMFAYLAMIIAAGIVIIEAASRRLVSYPHFLMGISFNHCWNQFNQAERLDL